MKTMVERVLKSSHLPGLARTRQVPIMALCASLWTMTGSAQDGEAFFASDVSPHVEPCFACHLNGGVADNSGARLVFRDGADSFNYNAMADFYAHSDVDQGLILAKISGGAGHGGAQIHASGSSGYKAIEKLLDIISGNNNSGGDSVDQDFWRGLVLESRERTLRRAAIMLAGKLPTAGQLKNVAKSEVNLRAALLRFMKGAQFHDFLITGANDRIHTDGFNNGMNFEFGFEGVYQEANLARNLERCEWGPDVSRQQQIQQARSLSECNYREAVYDYGVIREPLELIAHVVERNLPYKQILTGNYTMANRYTANIYGAKKLFSPVNPEEEYDPSAAVKYKKVRDKGQADFSGDFESQCDESGCWVKKVDGTISRPHAGVLTTHAWLARYPTTDTNRNRARARWTLYHFLGIDIERSAPRTQDPDALTDTNNPTMNNAACTVCHERMDPVAGAYQNFSEFGKYRDSGSDSLADAYKFPEWFGGDPDDTPYQQGDVWYRDMRQPGINGKTTDKKHGSAAWLGQQIVNDPRFAKATVAFWWPAIMGANPLIAPGSTTDVDYQQQLNAYNAQQELMDELAQKFRSNNFKAKQLFADMIMSPWFRAEGFDSEDLNERMVELASVGSGRLLSPEELDRKAFAIFGTRWNERSSQMVSGSISGDWTQLRYGDERIAYGGIDSFGVTERARELTALMSNVADRQAVEFACRVAVWDFNRNVLKAIRNDCSTDDWWEFDWNRKVCQLQPPEPRPALFNRVSKTTTPSEANRAKIETQIVLLYDKMLGREISRNALEVKQLYDLLESRYQESKDQGWVDNPCWLGSEKYDSLSWEQRNDPQGMVAAWSGVVRALMNHYWYLHD